MERKVRSNKLLAWSAKCSSIIQSYHIKALTPGMEFKSELFYPTKIKIELTSFENFENDLFTIFIKNFNTLELTLGSGYRGQLDCTLLLVPRCARGSLMSRLFT